MVRIGLGFEFGLRFRFVYVSNNRQKLLDHTGLNSAGLRIPLSPSG